MINSNVLTVKNTAEKINSIFNGNVTDAATTVSVNSANTGLIELNVNVKAASDNAYIELHRSSYVGGDIEDVVLLDDKGFLVNNNRFFLNKTGFYTFFSDTKSFKKLNLRVNKSAGSQIANVEISATLFSEKFSALELFKQKKEDVINGIRRITFKGVEVSNSIIYSEVPNKRYMLINSKVFSGGTTSKHYFVGITTKSGDIIYPESINLANNEVESYGTGQVYLNRDLETYVDLINYDVESINISRTSGVATLNAVVAVVGFVNDLPIRSEEEEEEGVLIDGKDFRFVKKSDFYDAWGGYIVNHWSKGVYISDDLSNWRKNNLSVESITISEGSNVKKAYLIPYDPAMKNTMNSLRVNVVLSNNKVFHNYYNGGGETDFGETKFWEMRGTNRKIPVKTIGEVDTLHRFDPTLPEIRYTRNATKTTEGNTFIEFQEHPNFEFLGAMCRTKKMVVWGSYLTTGERIGVWVTTDGGANYVLVYDFIDGLGLQNNPINTSSFDAYTSGLTMKKVVMVYPNDTVKEPPTPFTYVDVSFSDITKGAETTITSTAHGLSNGDIVLFTGTAQNSNWQALTCDSFDGTGFKQNVYTVSKVNDNSFRLKVYAGSYDTPLKARHVHSVNETVGGCVISTGEEHPDGWFLYIAQRFKDGSSIVNAFNVPKNIIYRLNSSEKGIQRACGFLMDNANDPNIIFNCDTSNPNIGNYEVDGRTSGLPKRSTNGIWRGKLSNIDDWSKFECVADIPEPAIWMYQIGVVIVAYYQLGGMVISTDSGETWQYFANGNKFFSGVVDGKIAIGMGYVFEWKQ